MLKSMIVAAVNDAHDALPQASLPPGSPSSSSISPVQPADARQPLTFRFMSVGETYETLSVAREASCSEIEKRMKKLLAAASSETENTLIRSAVISFTRFLDLKKIRAMREATMSTERPSQGAGVVDAEENLAHARIDSLSCRLLEDEILAYLKQLFQKDLHLPRVFDTIYRVNFKYAKEGRIKHFPNVPSSTAAARRILGISETATDRDVGKIFDKLIAICNKHGSSKSDIYGSVLALGSALENGLDPTSPCSLAPLTHLIRDLLLAILRETKLDDLTSRLVACNAAALYLGMEKDELESAIAEDLTHPKVPSSIGGPQVSGPRLDTSRWIEQLEARIKHLTQSKVEPRTRPPHRGDQEQIRVETVDEMRKKRGGYLNEIGKLRGALKRTQEALKQSKSELSAEKAKSKRGKSPSFTSRMSKEYHQLSSSTATSSSGIPSPSSAQTSPLSTSPIIDFTIQRQAAEIAELKRQLEVERKKNISSSVLF